MGLSQMYDASTPPARPPAYPVVAFYIGGDTPHVWTDEEIAASPATYGLPIYVHDYAQDDHNVAIGQIVAWLEAHQWEKGAAVAIDTETVVEQAWISAVDAAISAEGWPVLDYQSKGPMPSNPLTSGGRWIANWTGQAEQYPGAVATQYASAGMLGADYDASVIDQGVKLHQLHAAPPPPPPPATITVHYIEIRQGDRGDAVRRCQGLLIAAYQSGLGAPGIDGDFGPLTDGAVRNFQTGHGLAVDGIVGPITWTALLGG